MPGQRVAVRLGGTPAGFTAAQRKPPLGRPIRLYLVPSEVAAPDIRTRSDPSIHFVGLLVPDRNARGSYGNGLLSTSVPGPSGVLVAATDRNGTLLQKLGCSRTGG